LSKERNDLKGNYAEHYFTQDVIYGITSSNTETFLFIEAIIENIKKLNPE